MTSPSPALDLARRFGASLGLSEGVDGSTALKMSTTDHETFLALIDEYFEMPEEVSRRSAAEFAALYLPSFLRTFFSNTVDTFNAIHPTLFETYANVVSLHVPSLACSRFVREHHKDALQLRAGALNLIVDWVDRRKTIPIRDWAEVMSTLVQLYGSLTHAENANADVPSKSPDPIQLSSEMRLKLRECARILDSLERRLKAGPEGAKYATAFSFLCGVAFPPPEQAGPLRGIEYLDKIAELGGYCPWWVCEGARLDRQYSQPVAPCDKGTREELRTCARCVSVRYCSERHQKLHWKQHKIQCVKPGW